MEKLNLIPFPVKSVVKPGGLDVGGKIHINRSDELVGPADFLAEKLHLWGIEAQAGAGVSISLRLDDSLSRLGEEGYQLRVNPEGVSIVALGTAGIFYGIQTLLNLLPADYSAAKVLPCIEIEDWPRFSWRGTMLDVSRHFMPVEFIKKWLDLMAMHKLNIFHWHLTDDQGWRLEIKKYPKLTATGSVRARTLLTHIRAEGERVYEEKAYGGYYTQEQVREIVAYAAKLNIEIIPEIEMPGHASAVLAAYPHLACPGYEHEVKCEWGIFDDIYCAGSEEVFGFIDDIFAEVVSLFPSQYIHIGGDEVPTEHWQQCPLCQQRMQDIGLDDERELQSYFIQRAEKMLEKYGRKLIGWDEILEGGLAENATVMSWRSFEGGLKAARQGHHVIMSPLQHCYFDYSQTDRSDEPLAIGGPLTIETVYEFNPIPAELEGQYHQYILGGQGNIWAEYIRTPEAIEYMSYPRLIALAEVLWGTGRADYSFFAARLGGQLRRLGNFDVNYWGKA